MWVSETTLAVMSTNDPWWAVRGTTLTCPNEVSGNRRSSLTIRKSSRDRAIRTGGAGRGLLACGEAAWHGGHRPQSGPPCKRNFAIRAKFIREQGVFDSGEFRHLVFVARRGTLGGGILVVEPGPLLGGRGGT